MNIRTQIVEHKVSGEKLLAKVREIIHEGNVRRIIIKNHDGVTMMELPLTVGVAGAVLLPFWVAVGAVAALAADYRIAVEKTPGTAEETGGPEKKEPAAAATVQEPW
ncbi:MAG: DUF4342 domain-containing protein [Gemmatimonadetes bacterium]|nr:DUF4342 domain-containing protein [Gemmatimonadota bacterium]